MSIETLLVLGLFYPLYKVARPVFRGDLGVIAYMVLVSIVIAGIFGVKTLGTAIAFLSVPAGIAMYLRQKANAESELRDSIKFTERP